MRLAARAAALISVALAITLGVAAGAPKRTSIRWLSDFGRAQAQAKKSHRIMMVDFYADW